MVLRMFARWCCGLLIVAASSALPTATWADTLRGVVRDDAGQPVAGARIDVATATPKVGRGVFCPSCYVDCQKWTRTDEQGRFEIGGLDPKLKFRILATAPGKQSEYTPLVNPEVEAASITLLNVPTNLEPQRLISGLVLNDGGRPIAGALLHPVGYQDGRRTSFGGVKGRAAVSDEQGHFQLLLDEQYEAVLVQVTADQFAGTQVTLKPAEESRVLVPVGATVTGTLMSDGQPLSGVPLAVVQLNRRSSQHFIKSVLAITDADGQFAFRHLPADQKYALFSPVGDLGSDTGLNLTTSVIETKTFQVPGDGEVRHLGPLETIPGFTFAGRLGMPDGQPLPEGVKISLGRDPAWDLIELRVDDDGRFGISQLPPESYEVQVIFPGWNYGEPRWQPNLSQINFQGVRHGAFGVRLTTDLEDIRIPMVFVDPKPSESADQPADATATDSTSVVSAPAGEPSADQAVLSFPELPENLPPVVLRAEPVPSAGPQISVRGVAVDTTGKPIADAEVALLGDVIGLARAISPLHHGDRLAQTTSLADGQFAFRNVPIPLRLVDTISALTAGPSNTERRFMGAQVLVSKPGSGLAWAELDSLESARPLRIVLGNGATLTGRVVDPSGQPIREARVSVEMIGPIAGTSQPYAKDGDHLYLSNSEFPHTAITTAEGSFSLPNMPIDRHVMVQVDGPGFARTRLVFDTSLGDDPPSIKDMSYGTIPVPVTKSPASITLQPLQTVTVRVLDETGRPVTDGVVETLETNRRSGSMANRLNSEGEAVVPVQFTGEYSVQYRSEPLQPRVGLSVFKSLMADRANEPVLVQLPQSRLLTGRVVSAETGEPVAGAWVRFSQEMAKQGRMSATCVSQADGEFRLPVVPGRIQIAAVQLLHGFHVPPFASIDSTVSGVEVEIPVDGDIAPVTLKMTPGLIIEGTLLGADGRPIADEVVWAKSLGRNDLSRFNPVATRTDSHGAFRLSGMPPSASVQVVWLGNGTSAEAVVAENPNLGVHDMRLERVQLVVSTGVSVRGRVTKRGQPFPDVTVTLRRGKNPDERVLRATTDSEGRYVFSGLQPGDKYSLEADAAGGWIYSPDPYFRSEDRIIPADATAPITVPDLQLTRWQQTIAGIVVDPDGKPVSGVQLSVRFASGNSLPHRDRGPPIYFVTGASGHFRFEQLPEEPIGLMGYLRPERKPGQTSARSGPLRFPVEIQPSLNQLDVRIVFDPRLEEPPPDLDAKE
jgi:protocatechuate 3,4-dioxygenase beta subunit